MRARLFGSLLLMFALAFPALAQDRRGGSLDRVLPHVRQTVPGTFYDAEGPYFGSDGQASYRLKWMTPDGRIIWFSVDAKNGRVLGNVPTAPSRGRYRDDGDRRSSPPSNWQDNEGWGGRSGRGDRDSGWDDRGRSGWSGRGGDRGGWGDRGSRNDRDQDGWGDRGERGQGGWGGDRSQGDRGGRNRDQGGWRDRSGNGGGQGSWGDRGGRSGGRDGGRDNDNRGGGRRRPGG